MKLMGCCYVPVPLADKSSLLGIHRFKTIPVKIFFSLRLSLLQLIVISYALPLVKINDLHAP